MPGLGRSGCLVFNQEVDRVMPLGQRNIPELAAFEFKVAPLTENVEDQLTFALDGGPAGAVRLIRSRESFRGGRPEAQGPGKFQMKIRVAVNASGTLGRAAAEIARR